MRDEMGMPIPIEIGDRDAMFSIAPELLQHGQWVCLNIETSCAWPTRPQKVKFADHVIWIIPITKEEYPGVAIRLNGQLSQDEAEIILYRLLSVISWREERGISVVFRSGGNLPRMVGLNKTSGFIIRDEFDFTDLICPTDEKSIISLALMREARSLNHYGYAFLSYWRIIEHLFPEADARTKWMKATLPQLKGQDVFDAIKSISLQSNIDISKHLYESGRCAIAHANSEPLINPDNPRDARRLQIELPIVRELAICAIETCLKILTRGAEYRQHLYELRGWKVVLGAELFDTIASGTSEIMNANIKFPHINVRLRGNPPYAPFENLIPKQIVQENQELEITYSSSNNLFNLKFTILPNEEKLKFDIFNGLNLIDDGSVIASLYKREAIRFFRDYLLNGELQMWDVDTDELLSRLDAYLPTNMTVNLESCNRSISEADEEMQRRQSIKIPKEDIGFDKI